MMSNKKKYRDKTIKSLLATNKGVADKDVLLFLDKKRPPSWFEDDLWFYLYMVSLNYPPLTSNILQYAFRVESKWLYDLLITNVRNESWVVRCDVAELLSFFPQKKYAFLLLSQVLLNDKNKNVRCYAASSIGEFICFKKEGIAVLKRLLNSETDKDILTSVRGGLLLLGCIEYKKEFFESFESNSYIIRSNAYNITQNLDVVFSPDYLIKKLKLQREKDPRQGNKERIDEIINNLTAKYNLATVPIVHTEKVRLEAPDVNASKKGVEK